MNPTKCPSSTAGGLQQDDFDLARGMMSDAQQTFNTVSAYYAEAQRELAAAERAVLDHTRNA